MVRRKKELAAYWLTKKKERRRSGVQFSSKASTTMLSLLGLS